MNHVTTTHASNDENLGDDSTAELSTDADLPEQPPRIARHLTACRHGAFLTAIAYTEQEIGRGDQVLRGAYYGVSYSGTYESGYFKVDTKQDEAHLVHRFEAEHGDEADLFAEAMVVCRGFWTIPIGFQRPVLSELGYSLICDSGEYDAEDDETIFDDTFFNYDAVRDALRDSNLWF